MPSRHDIMAEPILSIIIPVYNGEKTISRTLESIVRQDCSYPYEIIVVDDASTDGTVSVVERYQDRCNIRLFKNEHNLGNGGSFYNGLRNCRSKYWCVLDADDYYSNRKKLQRQIDFLENDKSEEYVGVAHNYLIEYDDGNVCLPQLSDITEFSYNDFLIGQIVYCHTSTYMYRNLYNGNPPEYLQEKRFRGDTIRTALALMESGKKIKILGMVASVYNMTGEGIWSSLDNKKKIERQTILFTALKSISKTKKEIAGYNYLMRRDKVMFRLSSGKSAVQTVDSLIDVINAKVKEYESSMADKNGTYYSSYYDSVIETISCMIMFNHGYFLDKGGVIVRISTGKESSITDMNSLMSEFDCNVTVSVDSSADMIIDGIDHSFSISGLTDIRSKITKIKEMQQSKIIFISTDTDYSLLLLTDCSKTSIVYPKGKIVPGATIIGESSYIDGGTDVIDCMIPKKTDCIRKKLNGLITKILSIIIIH